MAQLDQMHGKLIDKNDYIDEYIKNEMASAEKCQLIASHPEVVRRYFNNCVQKFVNYI